MGWSRDWQRCGDGSWLVAANWVCTHGSGQTNSFGSLLFIQGGLSLRCLQRSQDTLGSHCSTSWPEFTRSVAWFLRGSWRVYSCCVLLSYVGWNAAAMPHAAHGRLQALRWRPAWAPAAAKHGRLVVREGHVALVELRVRVFTPYAMSGGS